MNLPDAPIAREGFFATHFFTVSTTESLGVALSRSADHFGADVSSVNIRDSARKM